jgi:hypothetical protein
MSDTEGPPSAGPRRIYGMDRILRIESHSPWIARKRTWCKAEYRSPKLVTSSGIQETWKLEAVC